MSKKKTVNFFSPYPPTLSGISDYSWTITRNIADQNAIVPVVKTDDEKSFLDSHGFAAKIFQEQSDIEGLCLFQVGNSPAHDYLFRTALKTRGIVVLHDLHLHGLIKAALLSNNGLAGYKALMAAEGPSGQLVADRTLRGDFRSLYSTFVYGFRQLAENALCVVVHSDWSANCVRRETNNVPVHILPHFCDESVEEEKKSERIQTTREHLGISKDSFVLSHFGFITEVKQIEFLIQISLLLQDRIDLHLLIAGGGSRNIATTQKKELSLLRRKTVLDHLPEQMLNDCILASNLVSLLRYPSNGETSGIGARCLTLGRAMLCFDFYAYSDLPRNVAVHIPLDTSNPKDAADKIFDAISDPEFTLKREIAAKRAATGAHISRVAASYQAIIDRYGEP